MWRGLFLRLFSRPVGIVTRFRGIDAVDVRVGSVCQLAIFELTATECALTDATSVLHAVSYHSSYARL
jgi:hypothetical protein